MPTMTMDTDQLSIEAVTRTVVGQVINSIAARDWDALAACVDVDVVYWRPGTNDRIDGVGEYIAEWRRFIEKASNLSYRPHTVLVDGENAMVEATAEWREPDGSASTYSLVSVMKVVGGRLAEEREYIVPKSS